MKGFGRIALYAAMTVVVASAVFGFGVLEMLRSGNGTIEWRGFVTGRTMADEPTGAGTRTDVTVELK